MTVEAQRYCASCWAVLEKMADNKTDLSIILLIVNLLNNGFKK